MLTIEHLSVEYQAHGRWTQALRDFSLTIEPGEAVGLAGPSGSGKSTVALAILRLIRSTEGRVMQGRILFNGQDLLQLSEPAMRQIRGRDIAMIFQDPFTALNPVLSIQTQMEEVLEAHDGAMGNAQWAMRVNDTVGSSPALPIAHGAVLHRALTDVQLDPLRTLSSYPHQLSGGQRQRVMIAMALLCQPQLVLADEPTTALDVLVQKDILELLSKLQKERHMAVLFITHHTALLSRYTSRVVTLKP